MIVFFFLEFDDFERLVDMRSFSILIVFGYLMLIESEFLVVKFLIFFC